MRNLTVFEPFVSFIMFEEDDINVDMIECFLFVNEITSSSVDLESQK